MLGSAGVGDALRLTRALGDQVGYAWYGARVSVAGSFATDFRFRLTEAAGLGGGADGMTFAIQNTGVVPPAALGGGLGYQGLPNSVVVEFDTYDNGPRRGSERQSRRRPHPRREPNGPGEDSLVGAASLTPNLKDGEIHHARIAYGGDELAVYVDDLATPALTVQRRTTQPACAGQHRRHGQRDLKVYQEARPEGALVRTLTATVGAACLERVPPTAGSSDGARSTAQAERAAPW